jgi:hypothetical protein
VRGLGNRELKGGKGFARGVPSVGDDHLDWHWGGGGWCWLRFKFMIIKDNGK